MISSTRAEGILLERVNWMCQCFLYENAGVGWLDKLTSPTWLLQFHTQATFAAASVDVGGQLRGRRATTSTSGLSPAAATGAPSLPGGPSRRIAAHSAQDAILTRREYKRATMRIIPERRRRLRTWRQASRTIRGNVADLMYIRRRRNTDDDVDQRISWTTISDASSFFRCGGIQVACSGSVCLTERAGGWAAAGEFRRLA